MPFNPLGSFRSTALSRRGLQPASLCGLGVEGCSCPSREGWPEAQHPLPTAHWGCRLPFQYQTGRARKDVAGNHGSLSITLCLSVCLSLCCPQPGTSGKLSFSAINLAINPMPRGCVAGDSSPKPVRLVLLVQPGAVPTAPSHVSFSSLFASVWGQV